MRNSQYAFEEESLERAYESGELSLKEYNFELRELQRSFQDDLEERAQEAYDRVMGEDY